MHVAIIAWNFPKRSESFVRDHALGLAARGHRVTVISEGVEEGIGVDDLEKIDRAQIERIDIRRAPASLPAKVWALVAALTKKEVPISSMFPKSTWTCMELLRAHQIKSVLVQLNPDIVHVHFGVLAGPLARLNLPSNTVVTWHGYDSDALPALRGEGMYRELFAYPLRHTVNSGFSESRLEVLGARPEQISVIPMGVDLERFPYSRCEWDGKEPLKVVSVGRLDEMKGHCYLVQAVSRLLDEGIQLELRIVGAGPLAEGLAEQIGASLQADRIRLLGSRSSEEVADILRESHLFALTGVKGADGKVETQGIAYLEAQATGLPVIGSDLGGVPESMIPGETGLLCPPTDVDSIKAAIRFFVENRARLKEFGRAGRGFVEENFSQERMLDAYEELYAARVGAN